VVTLAGTHRKANVGISNDNAGEKPAHRKTKVSWATLIVPGLVGTHRSYNKYWNINQFAIHYPLRVRVRSRLTLGVVDGELVNIPVLVITAMG